MINNRDNIIAETSERIKNEFGDTPWSRLQTDTRTDIVTAEICFKAFSEIKGKIDYSSVINPMMKGLELELRMYFYGYFQYIKDRYTAAEYAKVIFPEGCSAKYAASRRNNILDYYKKTLKYQSDEKQFTLGNFRYVIGAENNRKIFIDQPFLDYLSGVVFEKYDVEEESLRKWLAALVLDIDPLRRLRNDSSHAGIVQKKCDAEIALNSLIRVKKILKDIVCPWWVEDSKS